MSPTDLALPDAEALFASYLRSREALRALVAERVSSRLPREPALPYVVVARVGGAPSVNAWEDEPELQLEVWAETKESAYEVARVIVAETSGVRGIYPEFHGYCSGGAVVVGPLWAPDPLTSMPRYVVSVDLRTHPA